MKNKFEQKTYYVLDYNELDKIINDFFFGGENLYRSIADNEWNNDSTYTFNNIKASDWYGINIYDTPEGKKKYPIISEWDKKDFEEFLKKESMGIGLYVLLTNLVFNEIIPEGNYLIEVCW